MVLRYLFRSSIIAIIKLLCFQDKKFPSVFFLLASKQKLNYGLKNIYFAILDSFWSYKINNHKFQEPMIIIIILRTFLPSNSCVPCARTLSTLAGSEKDTKPKPLKDEENKKIFLRLVPNS